MNIIIKVYRKKTVTDTENELYYFYTGNIILNSKA